MIHLVFRDGKTGKDIHLRTHEMLQNYLIFLPRLRHTFYFLIRNETNNKHCNLKCFCRISDYSHYGTRTKNIIIAFFFSG